MVWVGMTGAADEASSYHFVLCQETEKIFQKEMSEGKNVNLLFSDKHFGLYNSIII